MPSQQCLDNIKKLGARTAYCDAITPGTCLDVQEALAKYCRHTGLAGSTPVPLMSPPGQMCYCCCSCFGYGTPVEVQAGVYRAIEDLQRGQQVLATDASVSRWASRTVTEMGGIEFDRPIDFNLYVRFRMADKKERYLVASADHLFLLPTGKLLPIQDLRPGDEVRQADRGVARVELAAWIQYTGGLRHIALGSWRDGQPLDGHLLNSNGLVTADLAVQLEYFGGGVTEHLAPGGDLPPIGSPEFHRQYDTTAYTAFVTDPQAWPAHSQPIGPVLINVPPGALAYFSAEQAGDIARARAGTESLGDSAKLALTRYLFQLHSAWFPDVYFIVDWASQDANAWYFLDFKRPYVVLSGGLVRLNELRREGLAVIMSHLVAQAQGVTCTGEADYQGVLLYLRQVWYEDQFFRTFEEGYRQLGEVFDLISPEHWHAHLDNNCRQPSIECRKEALMAAAASREVPECALAQGRSSTT